MDYARKIGKTERPKFWQPRRSISLLSFSDEWPKEPEAVEDHRLTNWKRWLAKRQTTYKRIKAITGRKEADQILNSCERVRRTVEMKALMDYASIPVPVIPDKYRGGPEFWVVPKNLSNRGDPALPDVAPVFEKKDLNKLPELTFVGLPERIVREKNLESVTTKKEAWRENPYLKQRQVELQDQIKLLIEKEPEIEELIIEGRSVKEKEHKRRVPVISVTLAEEQQNFVHSDVAIVLKIQEKVIVFDRSLFNVDPSEIKPITWDLTFIGELDKRKEISITFENMGNTVIRYHWRDVSFSSNLLSFENRISPFYFNKTEGLILQGQIVELKVFYLPRTISVFTEKWRLVTDPKIYPSPLIFRFWGSANASASKLSVSSSINEYLNRRLRNSVIREMIEIIISNVYVEKIIEPAYGCLFLEGEIFRIKNPCHYYHPTLVTQLRELYEGIAEEPVTRWNLSLEDLRHFFLQIKNPILRDNTLVKFNDLCKGSLMPSLISPPESDKYEAAYNILCSFANRFEVESELVLNTCEIREERTPSAVLMEESAKSKNVSQASVRTAVGTRPRRSKKRSNEVQTAPVETPRTFISDDRYQLYREIFFVRVHELLTQTIDQICAASDSLKRLNEKTR